MSDDAACEGLLSYLRFRNDPGGQAAFREARRLVALIVDLRAANARLAVGIPDGVTPEEWDIIRELRRVAG